MQNISLPELKHEGREQYAILAKTLQWRAMTSTSCKHSSKVYI